MTPTKFQALMLSTDHKLVESMLLPVRLDGGSLGMVANYADTLRLLQNQPPDLLLLDLHSAEADSLNVLRQLKHHPLSPPVLLVALGGPAEFSVAQRAFDQGLNEFVQMPVEQTLFRARLLSWVQLKRKLDELFRRQQELTEACRAAEANSRAKSEFLATMSHEIRTPMSCVIGMADLLSETALTAEQRGYLDTIQNSSESLLGIINDILDFSKIEAGKLDLERRPFDLRAIVEESLELLSPRALEKKLDLAYEAQDVIPALLEGDAQRLRQVLVNLIGNAVKFTNSGGVFVKVEKLNPPAGEPENSELLRLHVAVRDTGIGIQPDKLARLFRPFAQADVSTTRKYGGTGLGLVISRRLVELMGGRMWAESVSGEGSTFHFTVSLAPAGDSQPPAHAKRQVRLADLKILILEDNAMLRNLLFEQCRRWGLQPQAVQDAGAALDMLRKGATFDLALVDAALPGVDGATVAAEMQKIATAAMMPVVLMMAIGKNHVPDDARLMFANTVSKPIKPAQLCAALERSLLSPRNAAGTPASPKAEESLAARLPLRILLVDDNDINLKVAVRILQQLGYQPELAGNGREALELIEAKPMDLVFMDVMMPELDGLEATRHIRKRQMSGDHNFQSRIVIVAMTAHAMQGDREKCIAAGMDDYLSKPIRPKDVRDMIEKWGGKIPMITAAPTTAAPVATEELPVDMVRMKDLTDGNVDNLRELVEMYFNQTQKQFAQLREAIRDGKADAVRRVAHSCAGASATLGMTQLVPRLREMEKLAAAGGLTGVEKIYENTAIEFGRVHAFLKTQPELAEVVDRFKLE
jgi:signal transduction histidine kinase/HPt (histidine-containing phosphotransfer) domain-containing protein